MVFLIAVVIWAVMEASALGFIGGLDNAINKAILADHSKTIGAGFVYPVDPAASSAGKPSWAVCEAVGGVC